MTARQMRNLVPRLYRVGEFQVPGLYVKRAPIVGKRLPSARDRIVCAAAPACNDQGSRFINLRVNRGNKP